MRDQVLVRHPLQPFDSRNLVPGRARWRGPFSFDRAALAGARAAPAARRPAPPFLAGPLPGAPGAGRRPGRPARLPAHPVREFLRAAPRRRRPRSRTTRSATRSRSSSTRWRRGRSATGCCATCSPARDPSACCTAEQLRGTLPPRRLGTGALRDDHRGRAGAARAGTADLRAGDAAHRRRRRRPRRRPPADGHRRRRLRQPARLARLLPARAQAPAAAVGRPARAERRHPDESWTAHTVGRRPRRPADAPWPVRSTTAPSTCSAASSSSTTGAAREPLPRAAEDGLRLGRGARRGARWATPSRPTSAAAREWDDRPRQRASASPARTPTRWHVPVPRATQAPQLGAARRRARPTSPGGSGSRSSTGAERVAPL